jgi:CBS domain-containing protein
MKRSLTMEKETVLILSATCAEDLMTPNPVSIRATARIREAVAVLTDKGISAAPVIDEAGRPIGVLSRSDILVHDREKVDYVPRVPEYYHKADLAAAGTPVLPPDLKIEKVDGSLVRDIMTPAVFSVAPNTPARRVVSDMVALKVHRLFVVEPGGVLVGVISALDVLRMLRPEE